MSIFEEFTEIRRPSSMLTGIPLGAVVGNYTGCLGIIDVFEYTESWESGQFGLWTNGSNGSSYWLNKSGGTTSSSTGPTGAKDGTYYIYTEASSIYNTLYEITSPCIDLTVLSEANFSFWWNMYGAAMGTLELQIAVVVDGTLEWVSLWSRSGNIGNATWYNESIDLVDYINNVVRFRFQGTTGSAYTSDMAIDYIQITGVPKGVVVDDAQGSQSLFIQSRKNLRL